MTPLILNLVVAYLLQAVNNSCDKLQFVVLRFQIFFNALLEYKVSKITLDYFAQAVGIAKFFDNLVLKLQGCSVNASLDQFGRELV